MPTTKNKHEEDPDYIPPKYKTLIYLYRDKITRLFKLRTYFLRKLGKPINYAEDSEDDAFFDDEIAGKKILNRRHTVSEILIHEDNEIEKSKKIRKRRRTVHESVHSEKAKLNRGPGRIPKRRNSEIIGKSDICDTLFLDDDTLDECEEKLIANLKEINLNKYLIQQLFQIKNDANNNTIETIDLTKCKLEDIFNDEPNNNEVGNTRFSHRNISIAEFNSNFRLRGENV